MTRVLISGASVAGPALAYWLRRAGADVTVVEKSAGIRGGGYPIDIRGVAVDVVERMGVLPPLRAAHIVTRRISVLDAAGQPVAGFSPAALTGGRPGRDLEVPRGDLTTILYEHTRADVEYVFGDSIATLDRHDDRVEVTFDRGGPRTFDYVVGADGLHSTTRRLAFGPEAGYHRYLGFCFAGFTAPNGGPSAPAGSSPAGSSPAGSSPAGPGAVSAPAGRLSHEAVLQNAPGRLAAVYAVGDQPWVHALLAFAAPQPGRSPADRDPAARIDLVTEAFAGLGGRVPSLLSALREADDVYFDTVSQIRMPTWVDGRVALVGDAAYAPSFLSGQGTSLALAGAYVLAQELINGTPHAYETRMRDYVTRNQALAGSGGTGILPVTSGALWLRNQSLRVLPLLARTGLAGRSGRRAANALALT
jgi:2-polyprenyl-6-methoxyphenol hydroxylase-like FAD-dependent oxidoreductase